MLNENCVSTGNHYFKCVSWSAILVGALVGLGISFLLNLFGFSIGLSLLTTSKAGMITLAIGGFIGLLISVFVSMFVAGMTAGYLGRSYCGKRKLGVVYGFTTWCVALILSVLLASHIMHFVSNYTTLITNQAVVSVTQNQEMPAVTTQAKNTDTSMVIVNPQKATNTVGYVSFLVFILFIVGALASCFGGCFGMSCLCRNSCCGKCGCGSTCNCGSACVKSKVVVKKNK
ncbi:MAG: hypothetical protein NTU49_03705 [Gammaproteobacteria bacterium]|nr:hypothetical protein [Gammaproteobacteria bacterium]